MAIETVWKYARRPERRRPTHHAFEGTDARWRCHAFGAGLHERETLERWAQQADVKLVFIGQVRE
jgi:hypothetical protein